MKTKRALLVLVLTCAAGTAQAAPRAPHDLGSGIACLDCHAPYASLGGADSTGTATSGTATSLTDTAKAWVANQWTDGVITFTSGANLGQFRFVTATAATSVTWTTPLAAAVAAGDTYTIGKTTAFDIETKCKSCHNATGQASNKIHFGAHLTDKGQVGCGNCHDPHNTVPNTGVGKSLVRETLTYNGGLPISYDPDGGAGRFVTGSGNGLCQACHTRTKYYRNDGSLQTHQVGATCATADCHGHEGGFGTAAYAGWHMVPKNANVFGSYTARDNCAKCHTPEGQKDWQTRFVGAAQATIPSIALVKPAGTLQCDTCHNANADALVNIPFVSANAIVAAPDAQTALCGQCHQGRQATASIDNATASSAVSSKATAGSTTTTVVDSTKAWTTNQFAGATVVFTDKNNSEAFRTIVSNDATSVTWASPLAVAPAVNDSYKIVNIFTGTLTADAANVGSPATSTTLTDSTKGWTTDALIGGWISFTAGQRYGQARRIIANTATTVTVAIDTTYAALGAKTNDPYRIMMLNTTGSDADTVIASLGFTNVHYLPGAATLMGGGNAALGGKNVRVGYEYTPVDALATFAKYTTQNLHVASKDGCTECHGKHDLHVRIDTCGACHKKEDGTAVATVEDLADSRIYGWFGPDFDGDGTKEGLKPEVSGIATVLYQAIQAYAELVSLQKICYNAATHPYWFKQNPDGTCGTSAFGGGTTGKFTVRLLRAAHNYQIYKKDPGAWAHNPRYLIELLVDSIADLNSKLSTLGAAVAFNGKRTRAGHFDQGAVAWRSFDTRLATNKVTADCAQCHGGEKGLLNYLANPLTTTADAQAPFGLSCETCHARLPNGDPDFSGVRSIASVRFPPRPASGTPPVEFITPVTYSFPVAADNVCATCHSGRESKGTVDYYIGVKVDGNFSIGFRNIHYFAAAAAMAGADAHVGYEYPGKTYAGAEQHHGAAASCVDCHHPTRTEHTFEVGEAANVAECATCHGAGEVAGYKAAGRGDFDGDTVAEDLGPELDGLQERLYAAIQAYGTANAKPICYNGASHPYWFKDTNANGTCETTESTSANGFQFDPKSLKAAFNYQVAHKDPGNWAHNFDYIAQLLYDSIEDIGGDMTGLVRP